MAARTSSAEGDAPAEYSPGIAGVRDYLEMWKARLAETDWIPWLILGLAAFLRLFLYYIKPPHFDEGINGWFVDQVMHNGFYRYDPTNYHGPLHFYVLLLSESIFGRNIWALRLPVILVSIGCVWLTLKFEPLVGRNVGRIAALAMAVSPGFVFYGRYAIHEVWLQFFSMMFILGLLGLWKSRQGELPMVCRDGNSRDDSDQGNLRDSCRLRGDCDSCSHGFLCAKPRSRHKAGEANMELRRSCDGSRCGRSRDRFFLFGSFS